ncbi:MAG TPA: hypothetical protein VM074_01400 [Solimonas sp.]|nr:hypothetical protein [Solimonas sp.]
MNPHEPEEDPGPLPGLQGYRLDVAPERDLWPGIAARLPQRRPRAVTFARYAVAAMLVLGLGLALVSRVQQQLAPAVPAVAAVQAPGAAVVAQAEGEPMRGENRALVKANLQIVTGAEQQLRLALETDPDSASLRRLLASTLAQRQDLRRLLSRTA